MSPEIILSPTLKKIMRPYAKAIWQIALKKGELPLFQDACVKLQASPLLSSMEKLRMEDHYYVAFPEVESWLTSLVASVDERVREPLKRLGLLLFKRKKLHLFSKITRYFLALAQEKAQAAPVIITSANPLSEESKNAFAEQLKQLGIVHLCFGSDETLLYGFTLRRGDWVLDLSGKECLTQFEQMFT